MPIHYKGTATQGTHSIQKRDENTTAGWSSVITLETDAYEIIDLLKINMYKTNCKTTQIHDQDKTNCKTTQIHDQDKTKYKLPASNTPSPCKENQDGHFWSSIIE